MTPFFRFVDKRAIYRWYNLGFNHKSKYYIRQVLFGITLAIEQLRNKSWKPEWVVSFNMGWRISILFIDGIISFVHTPVNVTNFSIGSINCVRHFPQT
jgi:hypothetical protein